MLQNLVSLFSLELFGMYLVVSLVFSLIMLKLYFTTLKRIGEGKSYKIFVGVALSMYALLTGFMFYTIIAYGFLPVIVTSVVMYAVMCYPMKKFTHWIEQKGTEIMY